MSAVRLDSEGAEKILLAPSGRLWEDLAVLGLALVRVMAAVGVSAVLWARDAVLAALAE